MSITLDPTLATAQDSLTRHPIASLVSSGWDEAIPFTGFQFNPVTPMQENPTLIQLSAGSLYSIYGEEGTGSEEGYIKYLKLYYTDDARTFWTNATIKTLSGYHDVFHHSATCEMPDGNIGLLVIWKDYSTDHLILSRMVVTPTGGIVTDLTQIADLGDDDNVWVDNLFVIRMSNGTYLAVYPYHDLTGPTYSIRKRESTDFITWGSESELSIAGLDSPQHKTYNVSLIQISNGDVYLWFDYVDETNPTGDELTNIYYSPSANYGSTWGSAVKVTGFTEYWSVAKHPMAVQKAANSMFLSYINVASVLVADENMTGWGIDCPLYGDNACIDGIEVDEVNGKLYVRTVYSYIGSKVTCGVVIIDIPTWTVDAHYDGNTVPSIPDAWLAGSPAHVWPFSGNIDPPYIPMILFASSPHKSSVLVINHQAQTITVYNFIDWDGYSLDRNVDVVPGDGMPEWMTIKCSFVDAANNRLYCLFTNNISYSNSGLLVGYIDLTETPDPATGYYTWHTIFEENGHSQDYVMGSMYLRVYPESGYILVACWQTVVDSWNGWVALYSLTSGNRIKLYHNDDYSGFHYNGIGHPCYVAEEGAIYGSVVYNAGYDQEDRRGLLKILVATDQMTYHRPSFLTVDDYWLSNTRYIGNNELLMGCAVQYGGVAIYNTASDLWELKNSDNIEGFDPGPGAYHWDGMNTVGYDSVNEIIYCGRLVGLDSLGCQWYGVLGFGREGLFERPYYKLGTYTTDWAWTDPALFISGLYNKDVAIALDSMTSVWGVWEKSDDQEILWDREADTIQMIDLIPDGSEIAINWTLENPYELNFQLAFAWLFDPSNYLSIYRVLVEKGRKVTVQFGELINDVEYWQNQGVFTVSEVKISYERGVDPIAEITCAARELLWPEMNITATEYYDSATPREILLDLVDTYLGITEAQTNIPNPIDNSHEIWHQFIEMSFWDIMSQLAHHFEYVVKFDKDDKLTVIKITDEGTVSHFYSDSTKLINFSPDDSYSTFTNRVTVTSESHDWLDITYPEEALVADQGTCGWWGETKTKRYWFSSDHNLRVLNPRLYVIENPEFFILFTEIGGGGIDIEDVDPEGYWMEIEIDSPNLVGYIIGLAVSLVIEMYFCIDCIAWCGPCIFSITFTLNLMIGVLCGVAHYSFEIYGQPYGKEKQTIQGQANDLELQQKLGGIIVEEKMEDPFCYTTAECQRVAEYELMVVQGQRNRVNFTKLGHLQDELGDTIQVVHPYTLQAFNVFITALKRRFQRAPVGSPTGGYFLDDIEGWRVTGGVVA